MIRTPFSERLGIEVPLICGAMYPCTNPALVAAVSSAGGIGIVQPMSFVIVQRRDLREALREIKRVTDRPIGFNAIIEKTVRAFREQMRRWIDIALDEGVKLIITALGDPRWVVDLARPCGVTVYHDVTERRWAEKALDAGVDGLICVNNRAGGHAGTRSPEALYEELAPLGVPLICAGGIGDEQAFARALELGYAGVQMGTRFIASEECNVHPDYKQAILRAGERDIVLTEKISGVPVSVIRTPYIDRIGTKAGPIARYLLRGPRTKRLMRSFYSLLSMWQLRQASLQGMNYRDYFQAGKSVETIHAVEPAGAIVRRFAEAVGRPGPA
jgi:nitronate monooxygenase